MTSSTLKTSKREMNYPPFNLKELLHTIFRPKKGEKVCILIDLDQTSDIKNLKFLKNSKYAPQKKAYEIFYQGIKNVVGKEMGLAACDFFAYQSTGGSNLELPNELLDLEGKKHELEDIYNTYDIILCIGTYSATAPITAASKKHHFRGGTLHGLNDVILQSGLSVDYNKVSEQTEIFRKALTHSEWAEIDFEVDGKKYQLHIDLATQDAQKSHGLCHEGGDVVNLPAGEVYFVPKNAHGDFPMKFEEDGTIALMHVENNQVVKATLLKGHQKSVDAFNERLKSDPATGLLGELGFGTQILPYAKSDIQDEKIFGTFHLATGRNDHLKGDIVKERFKKLKNASHDDILFSSTKTPEIHVVEVRMKRQGKIIPLINHYEAAPYLTNLILYAL